jgi:hypothetical protein
MIGDKWNQTATSGFAQTQQNAANHQFLNKTRKFSMQQKAYITPHKHLKVSLQLNIQPFYKGKSGKTILSETTPNKLLKNTQDFQVGFNSQLKKTSA